MTELPAGSGGLVNTPRMSALIAKAGSGVLPSFEGEQKLRQLFRGGQSYITLRTFINQHIRQSNRYWSVQS